MSRRAQQARRRAWAAARSAALCFACIAAACGRAGDTGHDDAPDLPGAAPGSAGVGDTAAAGDTAASGGLAPGTDAQPDSAAPAAWRLETITRERAGHGVATLRAVRTARHETFDRIVFEFDEAVPGHRVGWADDVVTECGSGAAVALPGAAALRIRFEPARAHTEAGRATIEDRDRDLRLPSLLRLRVTCDFEARLDWVAAAPERRPFAVTELERPARLVVDVRHRRRRRPRKRMS